MLQIKQKELVPVLAVKNNSSNILYKKTSLLKWSFFLPTLALIFALQFNIMSIPHILLDVLSTGTAADYLPIAIQLIFAIGFVATMMLMTHWIGPKRKTSDKLETFASGIPTHGDARQPMAIKYFLVAILFVLFDVEVIFFYPYAVNFRSLGWTGFVEILLFVGFFLVGFIYIIKRGALKWED